MATNSNVSPDAMSLNDRLDALHNAGHTWMDPTLQVHLATSGTSTQNMLATADIYKNALANTGTPPTKGYADPALNQKPSIVQSTFSTIHNAYAPIPVLQSDVTSIQSNLQSKGYGQGLTVGTWNPQWQQALNNHATDMQNAPGAGNVKSLPFWKKVLNEVAPSTWAPTILHAVASYVHHMPQEFSNMLADTASIVGTVGDDFSGGKYGLEAKIGSGVQNALAGVLPSVDKITPEEYKKQAQSGRFIQDIGNLLNLVVLKGTGGALVKAIGGIGEAVAANAAKEGVSIAAKDLVTRTLPNDIAAVPKFTVVKSLYQAGTDGQKGIGFLSSLENMPGIKSMLPVIDALDAEGSRYYQFKQVMAQSMRIPLRQAGAQVQSKGMMAGLGLLGTSEAQKALGATPTYDASTVKPYAGILGNAIDAASMFVGAPTMGLSASQNVGQMARKANDAYSNILGDIHIDVPFRKGMGVTLEEFNKKLGPEYTNKFVNSKLTQFAAAHYADLLTQQRVWTGALDRNSEEFKKTFDSYRHEVLKPENKDLLDNARKSLITQPGLLGEYFNKEYNKVMGTNVKRGNIDSYDVTDKNKDRLWAAMRQQRVVDEQMGTLLRPEHRNLIGGSAAMTNVQDHLTQELSKNWATQHPAFDQDPWALVNDGTKLYHVNSKVNEFTPEASKLSAMTPYGKGVWSTENQNMAGRTSSNIFSLQHNQNTGKIARFLDLTKTDANSTPIKYKLSEMLGGSSGGVIKGTAGARANSTVRQLRDELGLMTPGKTEGALVNIPKETYTPEYKKLQKLLTSKFDVSGQDILDAYRTALKAGGKLNKDQIDTRIDNLTKSVMADNDYVGMHYLHPKYGTQTLLNPDRITAKLVKQDPSLNVDSLMASYLGNSNIVPNGALATIGKGKMAAQDVHAKVNSVFDELKRLGHGADVEAARSSNQLSEQKNVTGIPLPKMSVPVMKGTAEARVTQDIRDFLVRTFGYDQNEVTRLDAVQAASLAWKKAADLPSLAFHPLDAPQAVKDAFKAIEDTGQRVVLGTDIGHSYELPLLSPVSIDQRTSMLRKSALKLGIDPSKISDVTVAMARRTAVEKEINKLFASGKVASPFGDNGATIYSTLLQAAQSGLYIKEPRALAGFRGMVQGVTGQDEKLASQAIADLRTTDLKEGKDTIAAARQKAIDTYNQSHQIRDLSLKQMVNVLTRPVDPLDELGSLAPHFEKWDAMKIAKAVLIGYAKTPSSLVGLGKVEDFVRASNAMLTNNTASFFGKVPLLKNYKIGEGPLANGLAELPNYLARARDKWRFDMNPVFAYRRLAKTNVKAAAEGVPPTRNPYESLKRLGVTNEAFNTLNRTMPDVYRSYKELEPLDKFLQQADVFGIYNPAHMMAWQAHNLQKLGLSDSEIAAKLVKINTYGDRTPLERTVNTIFYPFSFNKTLYRSVGGYIIDHAGESMLINAGFNLYSHYDPNNDFGKWVTKHAPLLNELKKLNAFEHGTGLGQLGGINAPYFSQVMNLFSPQRILPGNAAAAVRAWTQAVPALGELNTLLFNYQPTTGKANLQGSAIETAKTGFWAAQNLVQHASDLATGHKRIAYQTTLTDQAQVQAGYDVVNSLKTQLSSLMGNANAKWPSSPDVPKEIWGMPFNSTSFGIYAKSLYPAYDPSAGAGIAISKNLQAKEYVGGLQGTFRYDAYSQFQTLADKTIAKLRKTNDPTAIQNAVNPLRTVAVNIAEQDPKFVSFYKRFYSNAFGPIEGLSK